MAPRKLVLGTESWKFEGEEVQRARGREWNLIRTALCGSQIHWLEGFLLFDSWRTGRQDKEPYEKQFGVVASRTRDLLQSELKIAGGRINRTAQKEPTWRLYLGRGAGVSSNILDAIVLYDRAAEVLHDEDSAGWELLRRAYAEWPDAMRVARAAAGSSTCLSGSDVDGEWVDSVSECLDTRKLALLGAIIKVTLLARARKLGVEPDISKPFLRRWYGDLVIIRDALDVLKGQWTAVKGQADPVREFATLATRYIPADAELQDGYDQHDPRSQLTLNERDRLLNQLCKCAMVTEARSIVERGLAARHKPEIDEATTYEWIRSTIYDFLAGLNAPVRSTPVLFGQFCRHLRRVGESIWSARPLAVACESDSALLGEIKIAFRSTLEVFEKDRLDNLIVEISGTVPELLEDQWHRVCTDTDDANHQSRAEPISLPGYSTNAPTGVDEEAGDQARTSPARSRLEEFLAHTEHVLPFDRWLSQSLPPGENATGLQVERKDWPASLRKQVRLQLRLEEGALSTVHVIAEVVAPAVAGSKKGSGFLKRLEQLAMRYAPTIRSVQSRRGHAYDSDEEHCNELHWFMLLNTDGALPVSYGQIRDIGDKLVQLGCLVDEAWFLRDRLTLWRTEFRKGAGELLPNLKCPVSWPTGSINRNRGGQDIVAGRGRFGTGCLQIDGTQGNWRPVGTDGRAQRNICRLVTRVTMHELPVDERFHVSCCVRTTRGATLTVQGTGYIKSGDREEYPTLLAQEVDVSGRPEWQHFAFEGSLNRPRGSEGRENGFTLYFITDTQDTSLRIDSIDFGVPQDSQSVRSRLPMDNLECGRSVPGPGAITSLRRVIEGLRSRKREQLQTVIEGLRGGRL